MRKYYKSHSDEYNQIRNEFDNLIIKKDRYNGIIEAKKKGCNLVILDDGLQDYKIHKNLNIVCFNYNQLDGNGFILPSGPLRESLDALKKVDIVIINGGKDSNFEEKLLKINNKLEIYHSYYTPKNIDDFKNHELLAVAGIANPNNFFSILEQNNLILKEKLVFPDHYQFTKKEIEKLVSLADKKNLKIVMTEKDFYKVNKFKFNKLNYLKVALEISSKEKLISRIKQFL